MYNKLIGKYNNCWIGQSTDETILKRAASGGIVTTLLIYALKSKKINGALVIKSFGVKPEVILAEDENEILSASGSKYCPVSLVASLKILSEKDGKFAVVGTPCQIKAIKRMEFLNRDLRNKIVLHIGLFCSHCISFNGTKFLLENLGIKLENILELKYREKRGNDTGMLVRTKDGYEKFLPLKRYWNRFFLFFFVPSHCIKCRDVTAELADISTGDAWIPGLKSGYSIFTSRTNVGELLVKTAVDKGLLKCQKVNFETLIKSQRLFLHLKKRAFFSVFGLCALCYLIFLTIGNLISLKFRWYSLLKIWIRVFRVIP